MQLSVKWWLKAPDVQRLFTCIHLHLYKPADHNRCSGKNIDFTWRVVCVKFALQYCRKAILETGNCNIHSGCFRNNKWTYFASTCVGEVHITGSLHMNRYFRWRMSGHYMVIEYSCMTHKKMQAIFLKYFSIWFIAWHNFKNSWLYNFIGSFMQLGILHDEDPKDKDTNNIILKIQRIINQ